MNRTNKLISILIVLVMLCIPIQAFSATAEAPTDDPNLSDDSQILFSTLFFNNHDDVEKIISYFDSNIEEDYKNLDIENIIQSLQLKTNYNETICIISNYYDIADYVEKNNHILEICLIDLTENNNTAELQWGASFHRDRTETIAKKYFPAKIAEKIAKSDREVDIKYSSITGSVFNKQNQYIHFNEYATGNEDSRDYAAAAWFVASELAWKNKQPDNAYMYLGYALHPLQDKESHGQIGRGKDRPQHIKEYVKGDNITHADDETGWEWTNSKRNALKYVAGSRVRYNAAVNVTDKWLKEYKNILK